MTETERLERVETAEQLYTLAEVKDLLKLGYERIHHFIEQGELDAFNFDDADPRSNRAWRISASSLNSFLEARKINRNGVTYERNSFPRT